MQALVTLRNNILVNRIKVWLVHVRAIINVTFANISNSNNETE